MSDLFPKAEEWEGQVISALRKGDYLSAIEMKRLKLPRKLYKYCSVTPYTKTNLERNTIWFANPLTFNDPYDSALSTLFNQELPDFKQIFKLTNDFPLNGSLLAVKTLIETREDKIAMGLRDLWCKDVRICCFNTFYNSMLMWSHYASQHQGICLEYDLEAFSSSDLFLAQLYKVSYTSQLFDVAALINRDVDRCANILACIHKHSDWRYENEWRCILMADKLSNIGGDEFGFVYPFIRPSAIYIGTKCAKQDIEYIVDRGKKDKINLYKMEMSNRKYSLNATSLKV